MRITGQEAVADVFGVAPKTIVEWQEAGFPVAVRGGPGVPSEYESQACIDWLVRREVGKVQTELPRDRLARVQADSIELDLATKRGQLIPAASLEPRLRAVVVAARQMWRNKPGPLAEKMTGLDRRQREQLLREAFDEFLLKLSQWDSYDPDSERDDDEAEAA
jgi:hypothetical protein